MRVSFNGKTHKVQVKPGEEGAKDFEQQISNMLALPEDQDFDVIFHCRAPGTGAARLLQELQAAPTAVSTAAAAAAAAICTAGIVVPLCSLQESSADRW